MAIMRLPRRAGLVAFVAALLVMASSRPASAATVEEVVTAAGCSTTAVWGLSVQIVDEVNCLVPGALAEVPDRPNLSKGAAVFPYLQTAARDALVTALDEHSGTALPVSSMLRTVAQQYLLYRWYQQGLCGIQLAVTPGTSNHEQGRALDTSNYGTWEGLFPAYGTSPLDAIASRAPSPSGPRSRWRARASLRPRPARREPCPGRGSSWMRAC
jgi:hypothetical protein